MSEQFNKAVQINVNNDFPGATDVRNLANTLTSNLELCVCNKHIILSNCIKFSNILILMSTDIEVLSFQPVSLDAAAAIN